MKGVVPKRSNKSPLFLGCGVDHPLIHHERTRVALDRGGEARCSLSSLPKHGFMQSLLTSLNGRVMPELSGDGC